METNETKRPAIMVQRMGGTLRFDVDGEGVLVLAITQLSPEIREQAMFHGFEQKVRDAAAIGYKQPDGTFRRPTNREKYHAMASVIETLDSGAWNKAREGGAADGGLLFEALCRMYEDTKTADDIRAWLDGKDEKAKAQLRRNSKVADIIAKIRVERNPDATTAGDDLLDELAQ